MSRRKRRNTRIILRMRACRGYRGCGLIEGGVLGGIIGLCLAQVLEGEAMHGLLPAEEVLDVYPVAVGLVAILVLFLGGVL